MSLLPAINQRIVACSHGQKIKHATLLQFIPVIHKCGAILGVSKPVSDEQIQIMLNQIINDFDFATLQDLELACSMMVANKLPDAPKIFGEFNNAILAQILVQYQIARGPIMIAERQRLEKQLEQKKLNAPQLTEENYISMLESDVKLFKERKSQWILHGTLMVPWLFNTERIRDEDFTDEEWRNMKRRARLNVMDRKQIGENAVRRMSEETAKKFEQECLLELRRVVYENYIKIIARK